jgi:hypothetical protein
MMEVIACLDARGITILPEKLGRNLAFTTIYRDPQTTYWTVRSIRMPCPCFNGTTSEQTRYRAPQPAVGRVLYVNALSSGVSNPTVVFYWATTNPSWYVSSKIRVDNAQPQQGPS